MTVAMKNWITATRPWSLTASATPVVITLAWLYSCGHPVNWFLGIYSLVNIILVHAAGNVWSDYHDYKKKVDDTDTYGVKILTSGQFTPQEILRFSVALNIAAIVMGLVLVAQTGLTLLWIGIAGIALSLLYPPLKYRALGDVVIILCYAFLPAIGTSFAASGAIYWDTLLPVVAPGMITVAILHANNTRDVETDQRARIKTFPILTGRKFAFRLYCFEIVFPYLWIAGLMVAGALTWLALIVLLSAPLAVKNIKTLRAFKTEGVPAIARLDEQTAKLQLTFSLLLAIALFA